MRLFKTAQIIFKIEAVLIVLSILAAPLDSGILFYEIVCSFLVILAIIIFLLFVRHHYSNDPEIRKNIRNMILWNLLFLLPSIELIVGLIISPSQFQFFM